MRCVEVHASRNYDILIGHDMLRQAGKYIADAVGVCSAALITDDIVDGLYADTVQASLEKADRKSVV